MRFRILPLEERIVLDAAALVDVGAVVDDGSQSETSEIVSSQANEQENALNGAIEAHEPVSLSSDVKVLVASSAVEDLQTLLEAVQEDVIIVEYDAQTDLKTLFEKIHDSLNGKKADSIAFVNDGEENYFQLTEEHSVTLSSINFDQDLKSFWEDVGGLVNEDGRIDLLACNLTASTAGQKLIGLMEDITGADVAASDDVTANLTNGGDWFLERGGVDLESIYFLSEPLASWDSQLATAEISGAVWNDANANGIQEAGEGQVSGISVNLLDSGSSLISSTITNATGEYAFTGLAAGDYRVEFVTPAGFEITLQDQGVSDVNDSDPDAVTGETDLISLSAGEVEGFTDAGIVALSPSTQSIETIVWRDLDGDGIREIGDVLLAGLEVKLFAPGTSTTTPIATGISDVNGRVIFDGLAPNDYQLVWEVPRSDSPTQLDVLGGELSGSDSDAVTLISGGEEVESATFTLSAGENNSEIDAGFFWSLPNETAAIGNFVWNDANDNGIQEAGEVGIPGVEVQLHAIQHLRSGPIDHTVRSTTTDANGFYLFDHLIGTDNFIVEGNPDVLFVVDVSYSSFDSFPGTPVGDVNNDGVSNSILDAQLAGFIALKDQLKDLGMGFIADIGVVVFANGSIAHLDMDPTTPRFRDSAKPVWDRDENGIDDVEDILRGIEVGEGGINSGKTDFESALQRSDDFFDTLGTVGDDAYLIFLSDGMHNVPGSYIDEVADLNTSGHNLHAFGVGSGADLAQLQIIDPTADIYNSTDELTAAMLSIFDVIDPVGEFPTHYYVDFIHPEPGGTFSPQDSGLDDTVDSDADPVSGESELFELDTGVVDLTWDAGLQASASISNFVWNDSNFNGIQDLGEAGVGGITVNLYDSGLSFITSTSTDAFGNYFFGGLTPGDYIVEFMAPGFIFTEANVGPDDTIDSDADPITGRTPSTNVVLFQQSPSLDAGIIPITELGSIGDFVWRDLNFNGIQDAGEPGILGATVNLYDDTLTLIDSQVTAADGLYLFDLLIPGDYFVEFLLPSGMLFTHQDFGFDNSVDSDVNPITGFTPLISVSPGSSNLGWDAGAILETELSSINSSVWEDLNGNGLQDVGESGLSGFTVNLFRSDDILVDSTVSGPGGFYSFTDILPGEFYLEFFTSGSYLFTSQEIGADPTVDSDPNPLTGFTNNFILGPSTIDDTRDAGLFQLADISSSIFEDLNGNGNRDAGDPGADGVLIDLYQVTGSGNVLVDSTTSSGGGFYSFSDITPGDYFVDFTPPAGFIISPKDVGASEATDSDADPLTGETDIFTIESGVSLTDPTLGINVGNASISDFVWHDLNANGIQDLGEIGISGVTVNLLNSSGGFLETTTTDALGAYVFDELTAGDYIVEFILPSGFFFSPKKQGLNAEVDSDPDIVTGRSDIFSLVPDEAEDRVDAGMYQLGSISNFVWHDLNANGIQDAGETGLSGISVNLLDSSFSLISSTSTDATGFYEFTGLIPNDYIIEVMAPLGFLFSPEDQGSDDTIDSDANGIGQTGSITIISNEDDTSVDIGLYQNATISNFIWEDTNANGIQDAGELGLDSVTVSLFDGDDNFISSTSSDASGFYSFIGLTPDDYYITVDAPVSFFFSPDQVGSDITIDSNINPLTGRSDTTTLSSGEMDSTFDAGLYQEGSIGSRVWDDLNGNGIQDIGEPGIESILVELLDSSLNLFTSTTTDSLGNYSFDDLTPDVYIVRFTLPGGDTIFTPYDQGPDDTVDSDVIPALGRTNTILLSSGEINDHTAAGIIDLGSISDFVWEDLNADGIQDAGELGIENVLVELFDSSNVFISSTLTDSSGSYSFTGLTPGDYIVEFNLPTGYVFSPKKVGLNGELDSDADVVTGRSDVTTITSGEDEDRVDAGIHRLATISDFVWHDLNANGIQDALESGLASVTVNLLDSSLSLISSTITDPSGFYSFSGLTPGDYVIEVVQPASFFFSPQDEGLDDSLDSDADTTTGQTGVITVVSNELNDSVDIGLYQNATISNFIWEDSNANGIQDAGELGLDSVTVSLFDGDDNFISSTLSDASGFYSFIGLTPDDYYITVAAPAGFFFSPEQVGSDITIDSNINPLTGRSDTTTLSSGEMDNTYDAGLYQEGSISDRVWLDENGNGIQDLGEAGIENVTVNLLDSALNLISTTLTDPSGNYTFSDLTPGDYIVQFVAPSGMFFTGKDLGGDDNLDSDANALGNTDVITITSGLDNSSVSAGLFEKASIGDFVWDDTNANGIQDAGEVGLESVTIRLYDGSSNLLASTTSNSVGFFEFTGLNPGDYQLEYVLPSSYVFSPQTVGTNTAIDSNPDTLTGFSTVTSLSSGESEDSFDAGAYQSAGISDFIWEDANANGIQDPGELGISGIEVRLLNSSLIQIDSTITDSTGLYQFADLTPDDYFIEVISPAGYIFSLKDIGLDDNVDSDINITGISDILTVGSNEMLTNVDAGLYRFASISDFVWEDLNANGIQDPGEAGIESVTVRLLNEFDVVIDSTTTNASGIYTFSSIVPGNYRLEFEVISSGFFSPQDQGSDDSVDSDADTGTGRTALFSISSNQFLEDVSAGMYRNGSITGNAWRDVDADGLEEFAEPKLGGITVNLLDSSGSSILSSTSTSISGDYSFTDLTPGSYIIEFVNPLGQFFSPQNVGLDDSIDSDVNTSTGRTAVLELESEEIISDTSAGLFEKASVGDFVWNDENVNGIQDVGELGIAGVTVRLYDLSGVSPVQIATTSTDSSGAYLFSGLNPGEYEVSFDLPSGFLFSDQNQGGDDNLDSDADPLSGISDSFTLESGEFDSSIDAGMFEYGSISDQVWRDVNLNGIQDLGDVGIAGVTVNLLDSSLSFIDSTVTNATGNYLFNFLAEGDYVVEFILPFMHSFTLQNEGLDDSIDSDPDRTTGQTGIISIDAGEHDTSVDAGLIPNSDFGRISDFVVLDGDFNGIHSIADIPIVGVTVNLLDTGLNLLDSTTSDGSGLYEFTGLFPGDYIVEFTLPGGLVFSHHNRGFDDALDSDADRLTGLSHIINIGIGTNDETIDAAYIFEAELSTISNFVWDDSNGNGIQDLGESGIEGVTVNLYDVDDNLLFSDVSDVTGFYSFIDLVPGDYYLEFIAATGYIFTQQDAGLDDTLDSDADEITGFTDLFTLTPATMDSTRDAGMYLSASVGDTVWEDANGNGIHDIAESGVENVILDLFESTISGDILIDSTSTDFLGNYLFTDLRPGDYFVRFNAPIGSEITLKDAGGDDTIDSDADTSSGETDIFSLSSGETNLTIDAGIYFPGVIGNFVWDDLNANGIQEAGEAGIAGVTVHLYDSGSSLVDTTTTDASGLYQFFDVSPGDYFVDFILPTDYEFSPQFAVLNMSTDSNADIVTGETPVFTISSGDVLNTIDAGMFRDAEISSFVWEDLDGDGIFDTGEVGIAGVTVELLDDSLSVIDSTVTDGLGNYTFTDINPGEHTLRFITPGSFMISPKDQGSDDTIDSDADETSGETDSFVLSSGEMRSDISSGMFEKASIGDFVWEDLNGNGIQDLGELGVDGISVSLFDATDLSLVDSTFTSLGGAYSFTDVLPGSYILEFSLPSGWIYSPQNATGDLLDSDVSEITGLTSTFTVESGDNQDFWDAGLIELASIGNFVWNDFNLNGIQDAGEDGIEGVTVLLFEDGNPSSIASTVTNASGFYEFSSVIPGDYSVMVIAPTDHLFTLQDVGLDDTVDSDFDSSTARSHVFTITSGETESTIDAGLFETSSINSQVWHDLNANGIQDSGEMGIAGVTVNLLDSSSSFLQSTTTNASGSYLFDDLIPDDYIVEFILPTDFLFSPQNIGLNDAVDSDPDTGTGLTALINLSPEEDDTSVDAGMYSPVNITEKIFEDLDGDGIRDPGEMGFAGVLVTLYDSSLSFVTSTITSADGSFSFFDVTPGDYSLEFSAPGYSFSPQNQGPDDTVDSDANPLGLTDPFALTSSIDEGNTTAGLFLPAIISDFVWLDANGNGIQDLGEVGLSGQGVHLFDANTDALLQSTTTNGSGLYSFMVDPGDYYLIFDPTPGLLFTMPNIGTSDALDSDADRDTGRTSNFSITSGEIQDHWDAGLAESVTIGNFVWHDLNANGIQDPGEPGIENMTVNLISEFGLVATTVTDASGFYEFTDQLPGVFVVEVEIPATFTVTDKDVGGDDSIDSDIDPSTGLTDVFALLSGESNHTIDAGIAIVNFAPTDILVPHPCVDELAENGTVVSEITAIDPDLADSHTFFFRLENGSLSTVDDDGRFAISGSQLILNDTTLVDFEAGHLHIVTIVAIDALGLSIDKDITIEVKDNADVPIIAADETNKLLSNDELEYLPHPPPPHVIHPVFHEPVVHFKLSIESIVDNIRDFIRNLNGIDF